MAGSYATFNTYTAIEHRKRFQLSPSDWKSDMLSTNTNDANIVDLEGLKPSILSALDPKSSLYINSSIGLYAESTRFELVIHF